MDILVNAYAVFNLMDKEISLYNYCELSIYYKKLGLLHYYGRSLCLLGLPYSKIYSALQLGKDHFCI